MIETVSCQFKNEEEKKLALITCGECAKQVSDKAQSCPNCGAPVSRSESTPVISSQKPNQPVKKASQSIWAVLILIVIGVLALMQLPSIKEQNLPLLPVEVGYRPSLIGEGLVLNVKNNSNRTLTILATLSNATLRSEKKFNLTISPSEVSEIGHLEGWELVSGDQVKLFNAEYREWSGSIP